MLKLNPKALIGAAALAIAAAPSLAEELRYAHVGAEGDIQTRYATEAAAEIEEATGGEVTVQVFPASQLGNVAEMVDGVRMGTIQMGHHDFASLARIVPEVESSTRRSSTATARRRWPRPTPPPRRR